MSASTLPVTDPEVAPRRLAAQVAEALRPAQRVIDAARAVVAAHRQLNALRLAWAMIGLTLSLLEYDLNNPAVPDARRD